MRIGVTAHLPDRRLPAEFVQLLVADAEMVADLVDDGAPHLVDDLVLGAANPADGARPQYWDPTSSVAQQAAAIEAAIFCELGLFCQNEESIGAFRFERNGTRPRPFLP